MSNDQNPYEWLEYIDDVCAMTGMVAHEARLEQARKICGKLQTPMLFWKYRWLALSLAAVSGAGVGLIFGIAHAG